jgi:hypothetical protein
VTNRGRAPALLASCLHARLERGRDRYPLVFRQVIDELYQSADAARPGNELLLRLLGILALIAFGRFIAGFYPAFRAWMNLKLEKGVRERVFGSILEKDYTFFGKFRTGDLVTRLRTTSPNTRISWFRCSGFPVRRLALKFFCAARCSSGHGSPCSR